MADEPMKLISTENKGAYVKFLFSMNFLKGKSYTSSNHPYTSPIYDIYDIAKIKMRIYLGYEHSSYKYSIQVRKCEFAKKLGIKLHVMCKEFAYDEQLLCNEKWSNVFYMGQSYDTCFNIKIEVVTSRADLMALKLYKDEEFTDFQLSAAEGSAGVAVHKAQLAANSQVFKTMLTREWKETTEGRINMEGVTLQTLQYLKDYMYMGDLPEGEDNLCPLLLIARCYLMYNLKADCLEKLTETVTSENLYHILKFSFINKLPELTFALIGATSRYMADDALEIVEIIIENEKK